MIFPLLNNQEIKPDPATDITNMLFMKNKYNYSSGHPLEGGNLCFKTIIPLISDIPDFTPFTKRVITNKFYILLLFALIIAITPINCFGAHGISIDGNLKYPQNFTHFDYTSDRAVKGGKVILHDLGSFDKMNPFTLKGTAPFGLEMFVFESLTAQCLDEPFAAYGLIAKNIELAKDKLSVLFTINENARFSDGTPITTEDVKFSLSTLKSDKVHPFYPYYYQDITHAEILDKYNIRFHFSKVNRELHMIAGLMPIMSKKFYNEFGFNTADNKNINKPPVGSGPYIVDRVINGKSIRYKKNINYWAKELPARKNQFNFAQIDVQYYRDQIVSVEAFKAGEFDFMLVNIAKQWARDMRGKLFESAEIIKHIFPHNNNAGIQGFLINTRKEIFKDPKVRKALGLAFDFTWTNKALFFNQYTRTNSFFSNSYLAATELPQGLELEFLNKFKDQIPPEIFTTPLSTPDTSNRNNVRNNLLQAKKLLNEAGWKVKDGILENNKGKQFKFDLLLASPSFERVITPYAKNLEKLGIIIDYRTIDPALYTDRLQDFNFDMIVQVYGQSLSPGNEQRNYFHSQSADIKGSRNLAGIKDPAVDFMVEKIIYAKTQEELTAACRALDRILWYGYYLVPNWYMNGHRIVYHNKFSKPEKLPLYYNHYQLLNTWWDKQKP